MAVGIHIVLPQVGSAGTTILANTDPSITLEVILEIGGVDSLAITTARTSLLPSPPDPLPLPADIEIIEGVLRSSVIAPINQINLSGLGISLPFDILFQLTFPNFASSAAKTDSLTFGPFTLQKGQPLINRNTSIAGYTFYNPGGGGPLTEFEYELVVEILEKDVVLPLDGSPLGSFLVEFGFGDGDGDGRGDLHFESITGNFFLEFPTVPTTINDIPTGFAGFQFGRLSLSLLLLNEIELPVSLDLDFTGSTFEGDTISVPVIADINYPGAPGAPAANGDTANKIGTYSLAVLAKRHDIPFYIAAPFSTFDFNIGNGDAIPIEERAPEEITEGFGLRTAPEKVQCYSPAFDVTPAELISGIVTEKGLIRPVTGEKIQEIFTESPCQG
ncbi:MAG: hypothetical protein IIB42_03850 [Candidatus Marinimicrobia bacterium]|nr:hypothetical protein [Candidatus Neomarinimicrobiota bacterium]